MTTETRADRAAGAPKPTGHVDHCPCRLCRQARGEQATVPDVAGRDIDYMSRPLPRIT